MRQSIQSQKAAIFDSLFNEYEGPAFAIRLWDAWSWSSANGAKPSCTIVMRNPQALQTLIASPNEITLGEAFIQGGLEIEGDIFSVFPVAEHLFNRPRPLHQKLRESSARTLFGVGQWLHHGAKHSPRRDHASIAYHYDQPVAFFEPWLGPSLAYSCAYFRNAEDPLDLAQQQKLELICRKLRLQPLERFLDIGCGWGSLVLHAARNYHAHAQGITLSKEQEQVARRRIEQTRLAPRCAVKLRDYRESNGIAHAFDKIASVGMFEHVGQKNLPQYFSTVRRLLRPGGVFLNHGITRAYSSLTPKASFIDRYVFPDGQLVTLSQVLEAAEAEGLEVRDVENLRGHYELTLRHWVKGMQQNSATLLRLVSEETYRIWLLYMAGSAAAFHRGDIAVHQILFHRLSHSGGQFPLTREDWYDAR